MEPFEVHVLGCGCAIPTRHHLPSAQVVNVRGKLSLVDCGECAQLSLRKQRLSLLKLRNAFLSHLHGDHCYGMPGLLSTFGLLGRTAAFHVYAPADYEQQLRSFCDHIEFEVVFHAVDTTLFAPIYDDRSVTVYSLPLKHSVPCSGFLFKEKPLQPHIRRDMIDYFGIPLADIPAIKDGADWTAPDGRVIPNAQLTRAADPPRSYAYCSDTAFVPELAEHVKGCTLLYHEATYGSDRQASAAKYLHSTAAEAARIARMAGVGRLMIGHYSSRYPDESVLLDEARSIFPNTLLADEGLTVQVG